MPAREGNWGLLDQGSDPVVADTKVLGELVDYYKKIADEITSESAVLKSIGDGDDSKFKGATADAVRSKSKEVAESLQKMSGRYTAIRDALTGYLPALDTGLAQSAAALADAEAADRSGAAAAGMSDPSQGRAEDAPPLTTEEQGAIDAKHAATTAANDAMAAAKAKLRGALDALNGAGQAAASTIRAAWDDGLHDTGWDKFKAFFAKILKLIVKIFTYIGIALAALAILIPGVGVLAFMGAVAAAVGLVAQIGLVAIGEGNVFDLVMAVVGVVTLGVGVGITKATTVAIKSGLGAAKSSMTTKLAERLGTIKEVRTGAIDRINQLRGSITGKTGAIAHVDDSMSAFTKEAIAKVNSEGIGAAKGISESLRRNLDPLVEQKGALQGGIESAGKQIAKQDELVKHTDDLANSTMKDVDRALGAFDGKFKDNPNWWNLRKADTIAKNDWETISKQFGSDLFTKAGLDDWAKRFSGIGGQLDRAGMDKFLTTGGFATIGSAAPAWHTWVNGGLSAWGKSYSIAGLVLNPVGDGADTKRPWTDDWAADKHPITF